MILPPGPAETGVRIGAYISEFSLGGLRWLPLYIDALRID
jgi:hypothetical protein